MPHRVLALTLLALPILAQSTKQPSNEELVSVGDKLRDTTVLRNLPMVKIGLIGSQNDASDLTDDEWRKLVFGILSRYNLPVQWTPTTQTVAKPDVPTIMVLTSVVTSRWPAAVTGTPNGFITNYVNVRFELVERIKLPRQTPVEWNVPVWVEENDDTFGSVIDKSAVVEMVKKLTEKFCLSYLSANR